MPSEPPEADQIRSLLAKFNQYSSCQRLDDAERTLREAFLLVERAGIANSPVAGLVVRNLCNTLAAQNRWEEAQQFAERELAILEPNVRPENIALADAYQRLGHCHFNQNRSEQAIDFYHRALRTFRASQGEDGFTVLCLLNALGRCFEKQRDWEQAESVLREALALAERAHADHPLLADTAYHLGLVYGSQNSTDRCVQFLRMAVDRWEANPDHRGERPSTALRLLVRASRAQNRPADAISYARRLVAAAEREAGPNQAMTSEALGILGMLLVQEGNQDEEAQPVLEKARAAAEVVFGSNSPPFAAVIHYQAAIRLRNGQLDEASELEEQAITVFEQNRAANAGILADALRSLGRIRRAQGRIAEGESLEAMALEIRPPHPPNSRHPKAEFSVPPSNLP